MVTKIIWNKRALDTFDEITAYLCDNFSLPTAQNFAESVYERIDWVCKHPTSGRKVRGMKTLLMVSFGKHHQLYFRTKGRTLFICDFFDTRQDPSKRPY
jgi:plasmid stabilization system protein ParE